MIVLIIDGQDIQSVVNYKINVRRVESADLTLRYGLILGVGMWLLLFCLFIGIWTDYCDIQISKLKNSLGLRPVELIGIRFLVTSINLVIIFYW